LSLVQISFFALLFDSLGAVTGVETRSDPPHAGRLGNTAVGAKGCTKNPKC
jgi:hypothetical protein